MTEKIDLNTGWKLKPAKGMQLPSGFHMPSSGIDATVPGSVHTDLYSAGLIDDPFYADNENYLQWISDCEWIYETVFSVPDHVQNNQSVFLVFYGLDTIADIYLNERLLDRTANMFRTFSYEIRPEIKNKDNKLKIHFKSARQFARQNQLPIKQFPTARNPERVFVRKAQYSFGWDWGPAFPTAGIWRPVYLLLCERVRIDSVRFDTVSLTEKTAQVKIKVAITGNVHTGDTLQIKMFNSRHEFSEQVSLTTEPEYELDLNIQDPDLWWPNGLGEPHLYQMEVCINDRNEKILDQAIRKTGIRTVQLELNDQDKKTFRFIVNKKVVYIKGANWIPGDSFLPRMKKTKYFELLSFAQKAHMNMIRVWGGGIYEDDAFYRKCDELGLMVWQDFMFACAAYPDNESFLKEIEIEIEENINSLQCHPSVVIWCGNNENEWIWYRDNCGNLQDMPGFSIFHEHIPSILKRLDPLRPYWPTTPFGEEPDPNDSASGNRHAWNIWSYWVDYTEVVKDTSHFVTEFGFQAPACLSTMEKVIPVPEMRPHSRLFEFHNKQDEGAERLTRFLAGHLPIRTEIDQYIYLTQLNQGLALKNCLEHWRLNSPATNGSIIWQLNDCWPVTSWSLIDYYGKPKLAYYFVKRAFQPHLLAFERQKHKLYLLISNQTSQPLNGYIDLHELRIKDSQIVSRESIKVIPNGQDKSLIKTIEITDEMDRGDHILIATLYNEAGVHINRNFYFASRWKYIRLADTPVRPISLSSQENKIILSSGDSLVLFSMLSHPDLIFDNDGIVMLPNEQQSISVSGNFASSKQTDEIKIYTLNQFLGG